MDGGQKILNPMLAWRQGIAVQKDLRRLLRQYGGDVSHGEMNCRPRTRFSQDGLSSSRNPSSFHACN
jgi:hypothetical protein